jgi:hypothetical protein
MAGNANKRMLPARSGFIPRIMSNNFALILAILLKRDNAQWQAVIYEHRGGFIVGAMTPPWVDLALFLSLRRKRGQKPANRLDADPVTLQASPAF